MPTIERPGARVAYSVTGSGPAVILGHSLFCTRAMWDGVLARLEGYTFINVELRGHGESTAMAPFTLWDLADDWAAILDAEGHEAAIGAGLSTGGFTAMRLALRQPGRVRGLVLLDTDCGEQGKRLRYGLLAWLHRTTGYIPVDTLARNMFAPATRRRRPELLARFVEVLETFDPHQLRYAMAAVFGRDALDLSPIRVPALVAVGEHDLATPPSRARRIAGQLRDARLHTIAGAGHLTAVEQPEAVAALLREFLPLCTPAAPAA